MVKNFVSDKSGVAYIWAVGICALIAGAIIYIFLGNVIDYLTDITLTQYPLYGAELDTWNGLCTLIQYGLPGFVIFVVILWGHARSKAESFREV